MLFLSINPGRFCYHTVNIHLSELNHKAELLLNKESLRFLSSHPPTLVCPQPYRMTYIFLARINEDCVPYITLACLL